MHTRASPRNHGTNAAAFGTGAMAIRSQQGFTRFARTMSRAAGRPATFGMAVILILGWAIAGPIVGYGPGWELFINTVTTIVTFLMVFLIQHRQNRDAEAVQVKLSELIRALAGAQNSLVDLDGLDDDELQALQERYAALADRARARVRHGKPDTGVVEV
jgi:low affinity Fe/Cu permease